MEKRYYKLSEVGRIFGVHQDTVKKWCIIGDMDSVYKGGTYYIPVEAVEPLQNGFKSKRVIFLEKKVEALEAQISDYKRQMRVVAGMLLQIEGKENNKNK